MRSIWKGSIGFGMVAIPVKLYGATEDKKISMKQLHKECGGLVKMPRACPGCDDKIIDSIRAGLADDGVSNDELMALVEELKTGIVAEDIMKGYPISKEHFVPITKEEMEMLPISSLKTIQVDAFVKNIEDPRYFKTSYLLSPEEVGAKAFVLFVQAMEAAKVMGISKIAIRDKEQLCAVRPFNGVLLLQTLHWGDELRDYGDIVPFASVTDEELDMAGKLIAGLTKEVDLAGYKDEYRGALVDMISAKLEGKTIEAPTPPPPQAEADLTKQLLASLNAIEPAKANE